MLRRALLRKEIVSAEAPSPKSLGRWPIGRLVGTTVEAVEPRGKHLIMRFSNGLANRPTGTSACLTSGCAVLCDA